jgi:predicted nucleotidyltransferase component of viral defense system
MTVPLDRPATMDGLFLWIMHRFAEVFADHAILKGGMALRLIDSPRSTTDIDYVLVPYASKREVRERIEAVLREIEDADVEVELHSKMLRAELRIDGVSIQLEVNVALECSGISMSTGGFARQLGQPARVVRIMSLDWALAHKLAAWNERRLLRDLYDCYFFAARLDEKPAEDVLDLRLASVSSKIPALLRRKTMTRAELAAELRAEAAALTQERLASELGGLLPSEELAGLAPRIKAASAKIAEWLEAH